MRTYGLVLCESADGYSLHEPGSTDEQIAAGDAPALIDSPWSDGERVVPQSAYDQAAKLAGIAMI